MSMPAAQVILHIGEAVGQGKGELRDGVGPGLCNVVARNRDRIEIADLVVNEVSLHVAHEPQGKLGGEDAGVLGLVLLEDVGLHRASNLGQGLGSQLGVGVWIEHFVAGAPEQQQAQSVVALGQVTAVGRAGESAVVPSGLEHGFSTSASNPCSRMCFSQRWSMAAFRKKASTIGRWTVDGHGHTGRRVAEVKSAVQPFGVVEGANAHPGVAHLSVDVGRRSGSRP